MTIFIKRKGIYYDMNYKKLDQELTYVGVDKKEVHNWRPPCSCGVELSDVVKTEQKTSEVHNWRPPCSCGVSLNYVVENK